MTHNWLLTCATSVTDADVFIAAAVTAPIGFVFAPQLGMAIIAKQADALL
jgi:hypothetical protein